MRQEESPLAPTEISLSEYESEGETSIGSTLPLYTSSPPILPPPPSSSLSPINSPSFYHTMSQYDLYAIIRQQQEQLAAVQVQIQALIAREVVGVGVERGAMGSNMGPQIEVAKLLIFNGEAGKVGGFIIVYRLYLRMKMREAIVEEQVQWVLLFVQEGLADIWKENVLEDLEEGVLEYKSVGEFLAAIKKEFG